MSLRIRAPSPTLQINHFKGKLYFFTLNYHFDYA